MDEKAILPVEGNPNDEVLCICALRKASPKNLLVIAHDDGVEAVPRVAPPATRTLAVTTSDQRHDISRAYASGANKRPQRRSILKNSQTPSCVSDLLADDE